MAKKEPAAVRAAIITRTGTIIVAIIGLISALVIAYWQFILKPGRQDQAVETEYVGHVLDAINLQPIVGAKITLSLEGVPPIVYTDSEGVYRFKVAIKSELSGQIRVDAQGYQVYIRNITISPDLKTIEDIRLTASGASTSPLDLPSIPKDRPVTVLDINRFDASQGFQSTGPEVYISQGKAFWNVRRDGGNQYLYLPIRSFKGNVRLTVVGQIIIASNNCACGIGIGDKVGSGVAIKFGYYGGGCYPPPPGYVILAGGISFNNMQENPQCTFVGDWLWIKPQTPTRVELTINSRSAELVVDGIGKAEGTLDYDSSNQGFNTFWVGMRGDNDKPTCSGEIDSIKVESLP